MIITFITVLAFLISAVLIYAVLWLARRLSRDGGPLIATTQGQINAVAAAAILTGVISINLAAATQQGKHSDSFAYGLPWIILTGAGIVLAFTSGIIDRRIQLHRQEKSLAAAGRPVPPRAKKPSVFGAFGLCLLWGVPGIVLIALIQALAVAASDPAISSSESYAQTRPFLFGYLFLVLTAVALRYFVKDRQYNYQWRLYNLQLRAQS